MIVREKVKRLIQHYEGADKELYRYKLNAERSLIQLSYRH